MKIVIMLGILVFICLILHFFNGRMKIKIDYAGIIFDVIKTAERCWLVTVAFCMAYQNGWLAENLTQNEIAYADFVKTYKWITVTIMIFYIGFKIIRGRYYFVETKTVNLTVPGSHAVEIAPETAE